MIIFGVNLEENRQKLLKVTDHIEYGYSIMPEQKISKKLYWMVRNRVDMSKALYLAYTLHPKTTNWNLSVRF